MNTEDFTLGNEKEALQAGKVEEVNNERRRFLKVMSAAVLSGAATLFSGCGGGAQAESKGTSKVASNTNVASEKSIVSSDEMTEEEIRACYYEYEEGSNGITYLRPWYSYDHKIGPGLRGVSSIINNRELFEKAALKYEQDLLNGEKVWSEGLGPDGDELRNFLAEFCLYSKKVILDDISGAPSNGVNSKDGSVAIITKAIADVEENKWIPNQYRGLWVQLRRTGIGNVRNPYGILRSNLIFPDHEKMLEQMNNFRNLDYLGDRLAER